MRLLIAFINVAAVVGCSHPPPAPRLVLPICSDAPSTDQSALVGAPVIIAQAVAGDRSRGEQSDMLRLESKLPGFGGWYLNSLGEVVVYMKSSAGTPSTLVREIVYQMYAARPEAIVRKIMAPSSHAKIVVGDYTLSELIAIEKRIANTRVPIPGFVGVGSSLVDNRVKVGFRDAASVCPGIAAITSLGVPTHAVIPEVWGEAHIQSSPEGS